MIGSNFAWIITWCQFPCNETISGRVRVGPEPFLLHQDVSVLHNSPDFVDNDLDLDQQPVVTSPYGDITFHPVVGEACEGERAVGPDVVTWTVERLDDSTAKRPASVWSQFTD